MAFVMERIGPSDYHRFDVLDQFKRIELTNGHSRWVIDRERDIFIISTRRKFIHFTEYFNKSPEELKQPDYFLMCKVGEFFGLEYKKKSGIISESDTDCAMFFDISETNLYLCQKLADYSDDYVILASELIPAWFYCAANSLKLYGKKNITRCFDIAKPTITTFPEEWTHGKNYTYWML